MKLAVARRVIMATRWPAMPIGINALAAPQQLLGGPGLLRGWALENFSASSTDVSLIDGQDGTGEFMAFFHMTSASNNSQAMSDNGVLFEIGLWLGTLTQALKGAVWVTPLTGPEADMWEQCDPMYQQVMASGTRGLRVPGDSASQHAPGSAAGNADANAGQSPY